jgi:hypothetical protein
LNDKQSVVIPVTEYLLALKRKGILTQATTWISFEDMMLSGIISQSPKDKSYVIPLT